MTEKSSLFAMFETDPDVEMAGVKLTYGDQWFHVRRPGGKNERFKTLIRQRLRHLAPRGGQVQSAAAEEQTLRITCSTFIETCLIGWGSERYGEGAIVAKDGSKLIFNRENAEELFRVLPGLAADIMTTAQNDSLWLADLQETDKGNSSAPSAGT